MRKKSKGEIWGLFVAACTSASSACDAQTGHANISLIGYSEQNYDTLDKHLGMPVCITGALSVDVTGAYFALQPTERDGVISPGFSRIQADVKLRYSGRRIPRPFRRTVCGQLENATPFSGCTVNECKWYRLVGARLRLSAPPLSK